MKNNRLITRTINSILIHVEYYDKTQGGLYHADEVMSAGFSKISAKEQLALVREIFETKTRKVLDFEIAQVISRKYAISEADFIKYGHVVTKEEEEEENSDEGE